MAEVSSAALQQFDEFRVGKGDAGYLVFQLAEGGAIEVVRTGARDAETGAKPSWEALVAAECRPGEPCWVTYHFSYETTAGAKRSKCVLLQWIPGDAGVRQKMQYAMWANNLKRSLSGVACVVPAGSLADVDHAEVLARAAKFERDEIAPASATATASAAAGTSAAAASVSAPA